MKNARQLVGAVYVSFLLLHWEANSLRTVVRGCGHPPGNPGMQALPLNRYWACRLTF